MVNVPFTRPNKNVRVKVLNFPSGVVVVKITTRRGVRDLSNWLPGR